MKNHSSYLLQGGTIIDGTGAPAIEGGVVLVEQGKILFVGRKDQAPACPAATVIDVTGLTVMPGLIDGHGGLLVRGIFSGIQALRGYVQHGVTTVITFDGVSGAEKPQGVKARDAIELGLLRGCARLVVGYVVKCTNGHNDGRQADGPWAVRRAVREMVEAGADFIKTASTGGFWSKGAGVRSPNYTAEELYALVDEAHAWGLLVGVNAHAQPGLERAIDAGADVIYHGTYLDERIAEKMAERKTWLIPTLRVTSERNIGAWAVGSEIRCKLEAAAQPHRMAVKTAIAAGVSVALGSATPGAANGWRPGVTSGFEAIELAGCGLAPLDVIGRATLGTATAYRIDQRVGSLEPGKEADILCLAGDPLANIGLLAEQDKVALVFQKGRVEYASALYQQYYSTSDFE